MTIITGTSSAPKIETIEEMRRYYQGTRHLDDCLMGIEIEYALARTNYLTVPSSEQTESLYTKLSQQNYGARFEPPTSALEIASPPYKHAKLHNLIDHINAAHHALVETAQQEGLILSPFGHWPHIALEDLKVVNLERYQSFFVPPREDMIETFRFFNSCMNIQVSLGYTDPDHLLRIVRMATALEPLLFLTFDSSCRYYEGAPITHSQNITQKQKMGINTGIPDFYYSAKTGAELIDAHIDFTLNHPHIFAAFDDEGNLKRLPKGTWCRFSELEARGYGPQNLTNYLQAQSESWRRACNIATIQDKSGNLVNHRAELCAFQNGLLHQRISALILGYLIGYDEEFYEQTSALLRACGIDLNKLSDCHLLLDANFTAACHHNNTYHDVLFGQKTIKDFALPFADNIESAAARCAIETPYIKPLTHILRSGRPDWLVYREKLTSLEETLGYIRRYQDVPNAFSAQHCADNIL